MQVMTALQGQTDQLMMASLVILFLFSLYSVSTYAATDSCQEMAASGNCAFYSDCVEKRVPCGPNGYALGYGKKYCVRFGENIDCFHPDVRYIYY